jgi:hypothetical protein
MTCRLGVQVDAALAERLRLGLAPAADVAGRPLRLQFTPVLRNPSRAEAAAGGDGSVLVSAPLPHRLLPVLPLPLWLSVLLEELAASPTVPRFKVRFFWQKIRRWAKICEDPSTVCLDPPSACVGFVAKLAMNTHPHLHGRVASSLLG